MFQFRLLLCVLFLYLELVRSDYTIDDSNYSALKFSENPAGPVWGPFGSDTGEVLQIQLPNGTMQAVDATQCYDGTYTYAACTASNNCAVQFSFTGSGITIYVLQAGPQGVSASLTIDSGTATTATLGAPPPPQHYIPRVALFDAQNISFGQHSAVVTVLDWNGGSSGMMLDYILVSQNLEGPRTGPSLPSSASPGPNPNSDPTQSSHSPSTPSPMSTSQTSSPQLGSVGTQTISTLSPVVSASFYSSGVTALPSGAPPGSGTGSSDSSSLSRSKKTNVAAVAGGAAGGVVGLLALLGLAFCYVRHRRSHHKYMPALDERPSPLLLPQPEFSFTDSPVLIDPFAALPPSRLSGTVRYSSRGQANSDVDFMPVVAARDILGSASRGTNFSHAHVASSSNISATPPTPVSSGSAAVSPTPSDRDSPTPAQLTARPMPAVIPEPMSRPSGKLRRFAGTPTRSPEQQQRQEDAAPSPDAAFIQPDVVLTDEQADFVNSLFDNNVPARVVARVLERMLANPQGSVGVNDPELRAHVDIGSLKASLRAGPSRGTSWLPTVSDGETSVRTAPPSYRT